MRHAFITTISPGYMFALNCNFNSNIFYGTNADFIVLYHPFMEKQYMDICHKTFNSYNINIRWLPMDKFGTFHTAKYAAAKYFKDEYESVCLIDADLFICCNVDEYFKCAAKEDILITATHVWSGGDINMLNFDNPELIVDRGMCQLADFPVFINPKKDILFDDWLDRCSVSPDKEISHPLISFNRSVCRNFKKEQIIPLDGNLWVCDSNYWDIDYIPDYITGIMLNSLGQRVFAIHNKWWKEGRASGEWIANRNRINEQDVVGNLDRGQNNFNAIRDFMDWFNNITPETRRDDFFKDRHDWRKYIGALK